MLLQKAQRLRRHRRKRKIKTEKEKEKRKRCRPIQQINNMCTNMQHVIIRIEIGIETRITFRLNK